MKKYECINCQEKYNSFKEFLEDHSDKVTALGTPHTYREAQADGGE